MSRAGLKAVDLVERTLEELFPELAVAPLTVLGTGFGSFAVETSDGVIFRIARHAGAARGHAREVALLPLLGSRLPLAVPDPRWRIEPHDGLCGSEPQSHCSSRFAFGAIGYRRLSGRPLTPDWLARSDEQNVANQMAAFLAQLHAVPVEDAELVGLPRADRDGQAFEALRDTVLPLLRKVLAEDELQLVRAWCDEVLADSELDRFEPALRHGDLWYGNVLVDEATGTLTGVLDWENAAIGDPAKDLARQLHLGSRFAEAVLRSYEAQRERTDPTLRHRIRRRWELLEFEGIQTAGALDDADELTETIQKLRAGPILAPAPYL